MPGLAIVWGLLPSLLPMSLVRALPPIWSWLIVTIAVIQAGFLIVRYRPAVFWGIWIVACVGAVVMQDIVVNPFAKDVVSSSFLLGGSFAVCSDDRQWRGGCLLATYLISFVPAALAMGAVQWLLLRRAAQRAALLIVGQGLGMVALAVVMVAMTMFWGHVSETGFFNLCVAIMVYACIVGLAVLAVKPRDSTMRA
jgi:hypothetical protein